MAVAHHFYNFKVNTIFGSLQTHIQRLVKVKISLLKVIQIPKKNFTVSFFHFSSQLISDMSILLWLIFLKNEMVLKPVSWSVRASATKIPQTGSFLKNRHLFLAVLGASGVVWGASNQVVRWRHLSYTVEGAKDYLRGQFCKLIPLMKAPPNDLIRFWQNTFKIKTARKLGLVGPSSTW